MTQNWMLVSPHLDFLYLCDGATDNCDKMLYSTGDAEMFIEIPVQLSGTSESYLHYRPKIGWGAECLRPIVLAIEATGRVSK